ncbi:hypothetical protein LUZ60_014094 [Juncus effusus]|nr:hypothetical protein LUZ60_014094 [Juncus effusus]
MGIEANEVTEPLITEQNEVMVEEQCTKRQGSTWALWMSTAVSVSGSFVYGTYIGYSSTTESGIRTDLKLSESEFSIFGSILTIGAMFGAISSGKLADFTGRKKALGISSLLCTVGWLAIYFGQDAIVLDCGRFLGGCGLGVFSYVVPIFIAEIAPKDLRGGLTTLHQLFISIGSSAVFVLGSFISWRGMVLVGLIPCITLLIGLFFIPESPRWLAKVGKQKEFEDALQRIRRKDKNILEEAAEIQEYLESLDRLPKTRILDLLQKRYIRPFTIGLVLVILQPLGGISAIVLYAGFILESAGSSKKLGTILMGTIQIPITLAGAILMDKLGRRTLLMVSASGTFIGCAFTGISFYLKEKSLCLDSVPTLAICGMVIYIASYPIGMGAVPWVIMSEIFSIDVKAIAGSLLTLVNWLFSFAVSLSFASLMDWSSAGVFFMFSTASAITILFVITSVPETKGRTLEEIQESFIT